MKQRILDVLIALMLGAAIGCESATDHTVPRPEILAAVAPDGEEAASFPTQSDIPSDLQLAKIEWATAELTWNEETARSKGIMEFFANRASMTYTLDIQNSTGGAPATAVYVPREFLAYPTMERSTCSVVVSHV